MLVGGHMHLSGLEHFRIKVSDGQHVSLKATVYVSVTSTTGCDCNTAPGDGCNGNCQAEPNFDCPTGGGTC